MKNIGRAMITLLLFSVESTGHGQAPPANPKAKIEFRWLADEPIKGVTEEKGIRTSCYPELSYPYIKPILTTVDVESTDLHQVDFSGMGKPQYSVTLKLTEAARKKLATEAGDRPVMVLATYVDGRYAGAGFLRKGESASFAPSAGFFPDKADADRIIEACKK